MLEITYYALAGATLAVWICLRAFINKKKGKIDLRHELKLLMWLAYVLLLARGVYFPFRSPDGRAVRMIIAPELMFPPKMNLQLFGFVGDIYPGWQINVFGNIIMFIPVGIMFPHIFKKVNNFWVTIALGFAFTFFIEFTQLFLYDRCSDVDDLLLNTVGAAIGAAIWFGVKAYNKKRA